MSHCFTAVESDFHTFSRSQLAPHSTRKRAAGAASQEIHFYRITFEATKIIGPQINLLGGTCILKMSYAPVIFVPDGDPQMLHVVSPCVDTDECSSAGVGDRPFSKMGLATRVLGCLTWRYITTHGTPSPCFHSPHLTIPKNPFLELQKNLFEGTE